MKIFTKRYHPPGTSPGTLTEVVTPVPPSIRLIDFTATDFSEKVVVEAAECRDSLGQPTTTWIDVQGTASPEALRELGQMFGLHSLALEDVVNQGQRAKMETYDDQLFVVVHMPVSQGDVVRTEQVSLFLGQGFLVSFCNSTDDPFLPVRRRLSENVGRIRKRQGDYLLYALLDLIVDQAFPLLEDYGEQIEALEDELLKDPGQETLTDIHEIRRDLVLMRRLFWPQRDVLAQLYRDECGCIEADTRVYLRDVHDHTVQILDILENYREMASSMLEVYLSSVSNRLNESMRLLTLIATLFIPLTFIAGVYGMNFAGASDSPWAMPELRWKYGYPAIWLLMIAVAGLMLYLFKRKRWL